MRKQDQFFVDEIVVGDAIDVVINVNSRLHRQQPQFTVIDTFFRKGHVNHIVSTRVPFEVQLVGFQVTEVLLGFSGCGGTQT